MPTPNRATVAQRTQIGVEVTYGLAVAGAKRFPTLQVVPAVESTVMEYRLQGAKFPSIIVEGQEWSSAAITGAMTYGELPYLFTSLFAKATPALIGTSAYRYIMAPSNAASDVPNSYTVQHGDGVNSAQIKGSIVTDLDLVVSRTEASITSGALLGQSFDTTVPLSQANEVQTLSLTSGTATSGTLTLTFSGQTTAAIPWNTTAAALKTSLEALSNIGAGNTVCAGGPFPGTPITIQFAGTLAGADQPLMTVTNSLVGTTPVPAVATTTPGAPGIIENVPVLPATISVFMDPTLGAIGTTRLQGLLKYELKIAGRWHPVWVVDATLPSFGAIVEAPPTATATLTLVADSQAMGLLTQFRAGTTAYLQLVATGPAITGGGAYGLTLNMPFQVRKPQKYADDAGVYAIAFDLGPVADPVAGYALQAVVTNQTISL